MKANPLSEKVPRHRRRPVGTRTLHSVPSFSWQGSILVAVLGLSCCHNDVASRLLPREDGTVSVVSVAREEYPAAARNVLEANRYCEKQSRKAVFGEEQTEYQGVLTKRGEPLARIAKNIPGVGSRVTSDEDFRVTTSFKCVD